MMIEICTGIKMHDLMNDVTWVNISSRPPSFWNPFPVWLRRDRSNILCSLFDLIEDELVRLQAWDGRLPQLS